LDEALDSMRRIADYRVEWYEEPLPPLAFDGYAVLRPRAPIPIATGEALYTIWDFNRLIAARAVDVVQPDVTLCGGLDEAKAIALLCRLNNVRFSPHVWGTGVGLAAAVHLVAALPDYPHTDHIPAPTLVEYDVGDNPLRDQVLTRPLRPVNGRIAVPEAPGLGIDLDRDALQRFRVD
jgi:D-galactarolactone cycloisomerase